MTDPPVSITRCAQPGAPVPDGCSAPGAWTTVARTVAVRATVPPWCPPGGRPAAGTAPSSRRGGYRPASTRGSTGPGVKAAPGHGADDLTRRAEWRLDVCGPGRQASPPRRPAPGSAASTCNGEDAPEVTARDHPAPAPAGLPLRQSRAALLPRRATRPRGLSPFPVPRAGRLGRMPAAVGRAGAGLDAASRAERPSSRTHGRAAPGNANRSRSAPRHPGRRPRNPGRPAADDRGGDRRAAGVPGRLLPLAPPAAGPPAVRLPGGGVRVRRSALTAWLRQLEDTQDGQE